MQLGMSRVPASSSDTRSRFSRHCCCCGVMYRPTDMPEKIILSTVSAWELGEKCETTVARKNDALREAKVAKLDGDLSENAPYQAAKEKFRTMGRIQRRLTHEMDQLLAQGHRLVDPLTWVNDNVPEEVELGAVVVVDLDREREK